MRRWQSFDFACRQLPSSVNFACLLICQSQPIEQNLPRKNSIRFSHSNTAIFMKPNPYQSTASDLVRSKGSRFVRWIAIGLSLILCACPACVAAYAWTMHLKWKASGAYTTNSFPMHKFAMDTSCLTIACVTITAGCWVLWTIANRDRRPAPPESRRTSREADDESSGG